MNQLVKRQRIFLAALFLCGFLVYANTLTKPFLCDDYAVLYRLVRYKNFSTPGFFRPLSDITLYGCYLVAGLHSWFFNVFNLLVHISSAFLVFKIVGSLSFVDAAKRTFTAVTAAFFFLLFP